MRVGLVVRSVCTSSEHGHGGQKYKSDEKGNRRMQIIRLGSQGRSRGEYLWLFVAE